MGFQTWWKNLDQTCQELLFPTRCAVCDRVVSYGSEGICRGCRLLLHPLESPTCFRCGREVPSEEIEYCDECRKNKRTFDRGFPIYHYLPPVSDAVISIKYRPRPEYISFYGREIVRIHGKTFQDLGIQALVPIPVHEHRLRKRGFNQASLLAGEISAGTGIPVHEKLLIRRVDTKPQKELNDREREKNLREAFWMHPEAKQEPVPKRVLLVDDIYTTGATITACERILRKLGAEQVYYTSICIGKIG